MLSLFTLERVLPMPIPRARGGTIPGRRPWNGEIKGSMRHFALHLCHGVSSMAEAHACLSHAPALKRLESPFLTARRRTGRPEKWHKVAVSGAFFEHPYAGGNGPVWDGDRPGSSLGMSHRTDLGTVGGKRQGPGRTSVDKPRPGPRFRSGFCLHKLVYAIIPALIFGRGGWGRRMSRRTNGLSSPRNFILAKSDGRSGHTRPRTAIPRDHPAGPARNRPRGCGGVPRSGTTPQGPGRRRGLPRAPARGHPEGYLASPPLRPRGRADSPSLSQSSWDTLFPVPPI
jgi:hypothetical protein